MLKRIFVIAVAALGLSACGAASAPQESTLNSAEGTGTTKPVTNPTPAPVSGGGGSSTAPFGLCGTLDFEDVVFPASLNTEESKAMALALSVSGSFEGQTGWANLAGDSDGMGMSMGLLQQNLGSGTLQPLLLALKQSSPSTLTGNLATTDLKSLETMLSTYQTATGIKVSSLDEASDELFPDVQALSPLDSGYVDPSSLAKMKALNTAQSTSVSWAVANVLSSTTVFVPRWKTAFTNIATSAPYRTLQVSAALTMFNKAISYFNAFGFSNLSSMLLMYDFVVQDGGFTAAQEASFKAWVKANPSSDETDRAKELLTIRLVAVNPVYRADVQSRKLAIINGTGTVHGSARNLPKQYCYTSSEKI